MLPALSNRFDIVRTLGEGGMGVVYEAFDHERNGIVALKTIREPAGDAVYRMKREFRALAGIEHPHLVRLYDLFADGERCFFTMELVRGTDLGTWAATTVTVPDSLEATVDAKLAPRFDDGAVRHAIAGVALGLQALHGAALLHRDLKPSNVLVTAEGRVVLLDFGLVADAHASAQQTLAGSVVGTVAYMAPEQARGESELTTAVDLYALGVVLYELLTGRLPFEGPMIRVLAAKQYESPERPSTRTMGVPQDLDDLTMSLLALDPAARPSIADVLRALGRDSGSALRVSSTRDPGMALFGRHAELATLAASMRATADGTPSVVLVRGRSGIGKSALLGSFARSTELGEQAAVFAGRCYEHESVPYKGLDGVVDALSRHLASARPEELGRLLPPNLADLGTLFPVLRRIQPIASAYARRVSSERARQRVRAEAFVCLGELLRRIGETRPLLVIMDDVQWADDDTAAALVELLSAPHPPTMLLLLGSRPDDHSPVHRGLFGDDAGVRFAALRREILDLTALDDAATAELARHELGARAPDDLLRTIVGEARGNPFATCELVRFVQDADADGDSFGSGSSIDLLVRRRADSLDEKARTLLDLVAIAGEPTDSVVLMRAAGIDDGERGPIDRLRMHRWVRSSRAGASSFIDTVHDRMREAIATALDDETKSELHRRLAIALEGLEHPPHDRLARHFAAGGDRALAFHHAVAAAESATAALAFRRASELYDLAAENAPDPMRAGLCAPHAEALVAADRYQDASRIWLEAAAAAQGAQQRGYRRRAAECLLYAGRLDDGLQLLGEVAADLGVRIPEGRWATLWEVVKARIAVACRGLRFTIVPEERIRRIDLERVQTLGALAVQYTPLDPFAGLIAVSRFLREALALGDVEELATALGLEAAVRAGFRGLGNVDAVVAALERLAGEHGAVRANAWVHLTRAWSASFTGRPGDALAPISIGIKQIEAIVPAPTWLLSLAYYVLGYACAFAIGTAEMERIVRFIEERELVDGPYAELRLRGTCMVHWHLRHGRTAEVHAAAADAMWEPTTRRELVLRTMSRLYSAWASLYEADPTTARETARRAHELMKQNGSHRVALLRGRCLVLQSASALVLGNPLEARRAAKSFGRARGAAEHTFVLWLRALVELCEGRATEAADALEALRVHCHAAHNPLVEATACWALGRLHEDARGKAARARFVEMVEGTGLIDPDRFFWAQFPVGAAPDRLGTTSFAWAPR